MNPKFTAAFLFAFVLIGFSSVSPLIVAKLKPKDELPRFEPVSEFTLTDSNASTFSSYSLKGKVWVANMFFTSCQGPCPIMSAHIARLAEMYKKMPEVNFVSISVDPERDTPEAMTEYAEKFKADTSRWHFLTGEMDEIVDIAVNKFYIGSADNPRLHSTRFVLIDQTGQIRGYYKGDEKEGVELLAQDIRKLF